MNKMDSTEIVYFAWQYFGVVLQLWLLVFTSDVI